MDGNVTIALVGACFSVAAVAVGIALYLTAKFQSKEDAKRLEDGLKGWIQKVEGDIGKVDARLEDISKNVHYIRGSLERNKFPEVKA